MNETVGFSTASGRRLWHDRGLFQCDGEDLVDAPFICLMTGTIAAKAGKLATSKGATMTLEGFAPATGKITWRVPGADLIELMAGHPPILDSDHLLVTVSGKRVVLDLRTGKTAAPAPGSVFWCGHENFFFGPEKGIQAGVERFSPCDASGRTVAGSGSQTPLIGTRVGDAFVWPEPNGLRAVKAA
jgi:hypothetical protein